MINIRTKTLIKRLYAIKVNWLVNCVSLFYDEESGHKIDVALLISELEYEKLVDNLNSFNFRLVEQVDKFDKFNRISTLYYKDKLISTFVCEFANNINFNIKINMEIYE